MAPSTYSILQRTKKFLQNTREMNSSSGTLQIILPFPPLSHSPHLPSREDQETTLTAQETPGSSKEER